MYNSRTHCHNGPDCRFLAHGRCNFFHPPLTRLQESPHIISKVTCQKQNSGVKVLELQSFWNVLLVAQNREFLFVFGGNDIGEGNKGQAIINGQANAMGIPTKKLPSAKPEAFYNDTQLPHNMEKITKAFKMIDQKVYHYKAVVFPQKRIRNWIGVTAEQSTLDLQILDCTTGHVGSEVEQWRRNLEVGTLIFLSIDLRSFLSQILKPQIYIPLGFFLGFMPCPLSWPRKCR